MLILGYHTCALSSQGLDIITIYLNIIFSAFLNSYDCEILKAKEVQDQFKASIDEVSTIVTHLDKSAQVG